jgi:hypothetical protein
MATLTDHESQQVDNANATGLTPVVFVKRFVKPAKGSEAKGRG